MSLLYNQLLSYDAPSITFSGNIGVSPDSILNLIQIGNPIIAFGGINNQSSLTTIGVISYDYAPTGQITIEVTSSSRTAVLSLQQI
jgi:hypothetical protein